MKFIVTITFLCFFAVASGKIISTVVNSIEDFKHQHPDVYLIEMQVAEGNVNATRSYSLGARQIGDVVVANANKKTAWPTSQNVTTTLTYPSTGGNGAYLTYILVNCEQTSNYGRAYVTYGGVGQHFIQIVVEAQFTTYFNYAAFFYGIK